MCPSDSAFAISLGPTNPWLIFIAKETLVFRRPPISGGLWLLVPTFLLPHAPSALTGRTSLLCPALSGGASGILSYRSQVSLKIRTQGSDGTDNRIRTDVYKQLLRSLPQFKSLSSSPLDHVRTELFVKNKKSSMKLANSQLRYYA